MIKKKTKGKSCGRSITFACPLGARCNLVTYVLSLIGWRWLNVELVFIETTSLDCLFGFAALLRFAIEKHVIVLELSE